jgi:Spy/CpxP family protein refolding chaperone
MSMKKPFLTALAILALAPTAGLIAPNSAFAEDQPQQTAPKQHNRGDGSGRQHGRGNRIGRIAKQLNLTDAQKDKVKAIMKIARDKVKTIRQDASLSDEAKRQQVKAVNKQVWSDIEAILTTEQKAKLKEVREQMKQRHQNDGGDGPRHKRGDGDNT